MKRFLSGIFSFLAIMCMVIVSSVYINAQEISNAGRVVINEAVTKCATDGTGAAEKLNQLKDKTAEFETGVREVLNTYYSMEKTARGQLQNFSAKIDTTAATILANYVEAEAERDNKDNLTFETGVVLVSFAPGTAIDTIETIVKTEAVSYEMIDDGEFHINEDLPDYKKKRLEKLKDIKTDVIILAKISLEDTVERAIEKFKKYECVTSASSNAYLYADSEEDEIENPVYKNYNGFVYHTM